MRTSSDHSKLFNLTFNRKLPQGLISTKCNEEQYDEQQLYVRMYTQLIYTARSNRLIFLIHFSLDCSAWFFKSNRKRMNKKKKKKYILQPGLHLDTIKHTFLSYSHTLCLFFFFVTTRSHNCNLCL